MENSKLKLILASGSPRRRELLGHLKIPFEVVTLNLPEDTDATDPSTYCQELAGRKGRGVEEKLRRERPQENFLIVSADTIVSLGNKIYNKPADRAEAKAFLTELSGKTHSVFTGVSLILLQKGKASARTFFDESKVTFDKIAPEIMELYLDTGDSLDKAGAYGIQGGSLLFISKVDGSYANVVGFPLSRFVSEAESFLHSQIPGVSSWLKLFSLFFLLSALTPSSSGLDPIINFQALSPSSQKNFASSPWRQAQTTRRSST